MICRGLASVSACVLCFALQAIRHNVEPKRNTRAFRCGVLGVGARDVLFRARVAEVAEESAPEELLLRGGRSWTPARLALSAATRFKRVGMSMLSITPPRPFAMCWRRLSSYVREFSTWVCSAALSHLRCFYARMDAFMHLCICASVHACVPLCTYVSVHRCIFVQVMHARMCEFMLV